MLMGLSPLKSQFTNLCKCVASAVVELAVLKFTVKISIYKPMQVRSFCGFKICSFINIQSLLTVKVK